MTLIVALEKSLSQIKLNFFFFLQKVFPEHVTLDQLQTFFGKFGKVIVLLEVCVFTS